MIDININEIDVRLIIIFILVLMFQLFLCYKAKKISVKLMPVILLVISTIVLYVLAVIIGGWDGFFLVSYAIFSFILLLASGLGWAIWLIWAIVKKIRDKP